VNQRKTHVLLVLIPRLGQRPLKILQGDHFGQEAAAFACRSKRLLRVTIQFSGAQRIELDSSSSLPGRAVPAVKVAGADGR